MLFAVWWDKLLTAMSIINFFMGRKEEYKLKNELFLAQLRQDNSVKELSGGVLYRVVNEGEGRGDVKTNSVVTVHYKCPVLTVAS